MLEEVSKIANYITEFYRNNSNTVLLVGAIIIALLVVVFVIKAISKKRSQKTNAEVVDSEIVGQESGDSLDTETEVIELEKDTEFKDEFGTEYCFDIEPVLGFDPGAKLKVGVDVGVSVGTVETPAEIEVIDAPVEIVETQAEVTAEEPIETVVETPNPQVQPQIQPQENAIPKHTSCIDNIIKEFSGLSQDVVKEVEIKIQGAEIKVKYSKANENEDKLEKVVAKLAEEAIRLESESKMVQEPVNEPVVQVPVVIQPEVTCKVVQPVSAEKKNENKEFSAESKDAVKIKFGPENMNTSKSGHVYSEKELIEQIKD